MKGEKRRLPHTIQTVFSLINLEFVCLLLKHLSIKILFLEQHVSDDKQNVTYKSFARLQ